MFLAQDTKFMKFMGGGWVAFANQYRLSRNSVYEDLPIILKEVDTASLYSKE